MLTGILLDNEQTGVAVFVQSWLAPDPVNVSKLLRLPDVYLTG
jgi:hypothetical protein